MSHLLLIIIGVWAAIIALSIGTGFVRYLMGYKDEED